LKLLLIMEKIKKIMLISVWLMFTAMTIEPPKTKVYLIMSYRGNDLSIEKVYLKKENAQKYCDMYKDSHNYSVEERELTE
jgi:hypothetical protein